MSFETNRKKDNIKKAYLIEDHMESDFNTLQNKYLEFIRYYDDIIEYETILNCLTRQEYDKIKDEIHRKINSLPEIINYIDSLVSNLNSQEAKDLSLKVKINEQIRIVIEKLKPKQNELLNMLNRIKDKEARLGKRLSIASVEDSIMNTNTDDRMYSDAQQGYNRGSFRESKLFVKDLVDNEDYLKKRQEELEEIKKVSSHVKDITVSMKMEVNDQGKKLRSIEENVIESNINTKKAEFEIQQAEKTTRSTNRKVGRLIFGVLFFIVSVILILYFNLQ